MNQPILVTGGGRAGGRDLAPGRHLHRRGRPRPRPQIRAAADLLRTYLHVTGRRRPVLPVHLPGAVFAGHRQGGHLAPDHTVGHRTWEQFLAEHVGHRGRAPASWTPAGGRT
jgi:hypothetical protein